MKKLKRNYIKLDSQIRNAIKKEDIKQIKILIPKWTKLQRDLISLGVKINTINYNI